MRNLFIKCSLLLLLWIILITSFSFTKTKGTSTVISEEKVTAQEQEEKKIVQVMHNGVSESIPLETYLEGVVASEMPYTFELEALKAQCVAARTFVLKRNLTVDDSTSSQVYRSESEIGRAHV